MQQEIFRRSSMERISSPEQLKDYIRISRPGVWIALAAAVIFLTAAFIWSAVGSLPVSVSGMGMVRDGSLICYLSPEEGDKIQEGMEVELENGGKGTVKAVGETPISQREASFSLKNDYAAYALNLGEWNVAITIETDNLLEEGQIYGFSIVTDSIRPISFLLNSQGS